MNWRHATNCQTGNEGKELKEDAVGEIWPDWIERRLFGTQFWKLLACLLLVYGIALPAIGSKISQLEQAARDCWIAVSHGCKTRHFLIIAIELSSIKPLIDWLRAQTHMWPAHSSCNWISIELKVGLLQCTEVFCPLDQAKESLKNPHWMVNWIKRLSDDLLAARRCPFLWLNQLELEIKTEIQKKKIISFILVTNVIRLLGLVTSIRSIWAFPTDSDYVIRSDCDNLGNPSGLSI